MKNLTNILLIIVVLVGVLTMSCMKERKTSTTKGFMEVYVDEEIYPVIKQQKEKFESLYTDAKIELHKISARAGIVQFLNVETTKVMMSFRPMNLEEKTVLEKSGMHVLDLKVALSAVALIVNPSNPIDSLRTTQLDSIFRGITPTWNQVGWKNNSVTVATCVPGQNSGVFETVVLKILHGEKFASVAQIIDSSDMMIRYVEGHQNAIGMVSLSALRGKDDKIKMLALCDPGVPDSLGIKGMYFTPHQAHIYRGYYPLTSEVHVYYRSDMYEVGTGFTSFIAGGTGQQLFLNNGLGPATMPVRLVELTKREIQP